MSKTADDYKQARGALPWPVKGKAEQGQWFRCVEHGAARVKGLHEGTTVWPCPVCQRYMNYDPDMGRLQAALTAAEQERQEFLDSLDMEGKRNETLKAQLVAAERDAANWRALRGTQAGPEIQRLESELAAANERAEAMQQAMLSNAKAWGDAEAELALLRPKAALADWWGDKQNADTTGVSRASAVAVTCGLVVQRDIQAWLARYDALPDGAGQADVTAVLQAAYEHVTELSLAWQSGALSEHDGKGGWRSNRNADVYQALRAALEPAAGSQP